MFNAPARLAPRLLLLLLWLPVLLWRLLRVARMRRCGVLRRGVLRVPVLRRRPRRRVLLRLGRGPCRLLLLLLIVWMVHAVCQPTLGTALCAWLRVEHRFAWAQGGGRAQHNLRTFMTWGLLQSEGPSSGF